MKNKKARRYFKPGKSNKEDRIKFIEYWVEYIKTHSDEEWSKQQNIVIDSQVDI